MPRTSSSSKSQAPGPKNEKREPKARPIGKTANGKPTPMSGGKDKVDVAAEASFPASDPPAAASAPVATPAQDISPAHYLDPQELKKRKPR